jgi:hypothetical protein
MKPWRHAFLAQARSDFEAAGVLAEQSGHTSQATMLLQMAWEKLAKAALVMGGAWDPSRRSHKVAAKFASVLRKALRVKEVFGLPSTPSLVARLLWLQNELEALEGLNPALAVGENTEYPWGARNDEGHLAVRWPEAHLTHRFCSPERGALHLRKDFVALEQHFDLLF